MADKKEKSLIEKVAEAFKLKVDDIQAHGTRRDQIRILTVDFRKYRIDITKLGNGIVSDAIVQRCKSGDIDNLSVKDLRKVAGEVGVTGLANMTKEELASAIAKTS